MKLESLPLLVAAVTLSGCIMTDPASQPIGRQGANDVYEFSVTRYADALGAEAYYQQRNNYAARLCPQGYRIINEREGVTIRPAGDRLLSENRIQIACPA
ncbi:hypothetical protein SAMN05421665_1135 [Yoonia rosea]|uniref:Lipoprotein n=1 Tax=Yoonia rosea TaxID=287098 RepID=A0A1R3WV05_9RHOB|nr:hypothetical protein [Yoonia rosea]SIT80620.1 hypothetical protein SAMN05421665_1135 [Yoonia rosea]